MRVEADYDECEANAVCAGIAPDIFKVDDDDNLHILKPDIPEGREEDARRAINSCPKRALYERTS